MATQEKCFTLHANCPVLSASTAQFTGEIRFVYQLALGAGSSQEHSRRTDKEIGE